MRSASASLLVLGSYNGQDSLGDKCLLKVVVDRLHGLARPGTRIRFHLHRPEADGPHRDGLPVEAGRGLQSLFWLWHTKLRHTRLPERLHRRLSEATFPAGVRTVLRRQPDTGRAIREVRDARLLFIFGGTNFSRQWWWMNAVPYELTARIGRLPVYLGPQQYGPMTPEQRKRTRRFVSRHVRDLRFRNPADLGEFDMPEATEKILRDEVFSNVDVYPVTHERSGGGGRKTVLVNIRGAQDFLMPGDTSAITVAAASLLRGLHERVDCGFTFFRAGGPDFCDDLEDLEQIRSLLPRDCETDVLPYSDDLALLAAARKADACVSMSFHGAILAMIAGCPAIPLSAGDYYGHKYAGFEEYNPSRSIPVVDLARPVTEAVIAGAVDYISTYEPEAVAAERLRSHQLIEDFYRTALANHGLLA